MRKIALLLYPGAIFYEVALALELVSKNFLVDVFSPEAENTVSSTHLKISAMPLSHFQSQNYQALLIPGGDLEEVYYSPEVTRMICEAHQAQMLMAAICMGPVLLARAGILKGRTIAHGIPAIAQAYLKEDLTGITFSDEGLLSDKNLLTAKASSSIDFGIEFARLLGAITKKESEYLRRYYRGSPELLPA